MRHDALRLAGMMFLQYGGLGAWIVPLAHWLRSSPAAGGLGFAPSDIGDLYSTLALGGLLAPVFTGLLADRTFASEKIIGFANALMALLMLAAGLWGREYSGAGADPVAAFLPLFFILLAYSILVMTAITTGAAMTLRTLSDPTR